MLDLFKKSIMTGIGLALKTRDEVEDLAKNWTQKQRMSEQEGRAFVDDMMKKYDDSVDKLEERVERTVREVLKKMQIASRDEVEALRREVAQLRAAAGRPEDEGPRPPKPPTAV